MAEDQDALIERIGECYRHALMAVDALEIDFYTFTRANDLFRAQMVWQQACGWFASAVLLERQYSEACGRPVTVH